MRRAAACGGLVVLLAAIVPAQTVSPVTADQLVARLNDARRSSGFRIRLTMTTTAAATREQRVRQILVIGRRDRSTASTLYRQLWPEMAGGRALLISDTGDHRQTVTLFEAGRTMRLSERMQADRFFESDLLIEDVAEGFWYWPRPRAAGHEAAGAYDCTIVDFQPPPGAGSAYSLVKAWLSPDTRLALRIDQFGPDRRPAKKIELLRLVRQNERWLPTILTVEPADGRSRTVLESVKSEQDLALPAADFAAGAVERALRDSR